MSRYGFALIAAVAILTPAKAVAQSDEWSNYMSPRGAAAAVRASRNFNLWLTLVCSPGAGGQRATLFLTVTDPEGRATPTQIEGFRRLAADAAGPGALMVSAGERILKVLSLNRQQVRGAYEYAASLDRDEVAAFANASEIRVQIGQVSFLFTGAGSAQAMASVPCSDGTALVSLSSNAAVYGPVPDFAIGQIVDERNLRAAYPQSPQAWIYFGGGLLPNDLDRGSMIFGEGADGSRFLVYLFQDAGRTADGAIIHRRILAKQSILHASQEVMAFECHPRNGHAVLTFVNQRRQTAHGLVERRGALVEERWPRAQSRSCEVEVD